MGINPPTQEAPTVTAHTITTRPVAATERGSLSGHEARCSCGFHATTSLSEREAAKLGHDHVAWARKAGK